jgi:hypothetical protein
MTVPRMARQRRARINCIVLVITRMNQMAKETHLRVEHTFNLRGGKPGTDYGMVQDVEGTNKLMMVCFASKEYF